MVRRNGQGQGVGLFNKLKLVLLADIEDKKVIWSPSSNGQFVTKSTWEALRYKEEKDLWAGIIWFSKSVSRWAFISWLVCRGKLATKDRLRGWGMAAEAVRVLCSRKDENLQHLLAFLGRLRIMC